MKKIRLLMVVLFSTNRPTKASCHVNFLKVSFHMFNELLISSEGVCHPLIIINSGTYHIYQQPRKNNFKFNFFNSIRL